jgi:antibiotic biosynthesis monooxygenase (ABM) superfamily enzyme
MIFALKLVVLPETSRNPSYILVSLSLLPLSLGLGKSGENWAPMARSVMDGLAVATLLTLVVVPLIYAVVELFAEKIRVKREARARVKYGEDLAPETT